MRFLHYTSALCLAFLLWACDQPPVWHHRDVTGIMPDLEFTLIGSDGNKVGASAFLGKTTLLFFGFTHCPGICPSTLASVRIALAEMGPAAEEVQMLLVTVDPARDTPEALQEYTARFGPWLDGLTGSEESLKALNSAYKVAFEWLPADKTGNYDVMHSTVVYAFDSRGHCRLLIRDVADTITLVADLNRLVNEAG